MNRPGRSPKMSNVSESLRSLTNKEQMSEFPALILTQGQVGGQCCGVEPFHFDHVPVPAIVKMAAPAPAPVL